MEDILLAFCFLFRNICVKFACVSLFFDVKYSVQIATKKTRARVINSSPIDWTLERRPRVHGTDTNFGRFVEGENINQYVRTVPCTFQVR